MTVQEVMRFDNGISNTNKHSNKIISFFLKLLNYLFNLMEMINNSYQSKSDLESKSDLKLHTDLESNKAKLDKRIPESSNSLKFNSQYTDSWLDSNLSIDSDTDEVYIIDEPLFGLGQGQSYKEKLTILPIEHHKAWYMYKNAQSCFWTAEEIDMSDDPADWKLLSRDEKYFIEHIFAFFSGADAIVNENLIENFMQIIPHMEMKCFYGFQYMMENIHNEVYSLTIDVLVKDENHKKQLFEAVHQMPSIARLYNWAQTWISSGKDLTKGSREWVHHQAKLLVAFACMEGIMFSGPFCALFWLKERGILKGLTFSNELISRDEGLHMEFACLLYQYINDKPADSEIRAIVKEAVEFEKEFITKSLPVRLIGMNSQKMNTYIEYVADYLLLQLGHSREYFVENPFPFMKKISINGKTNFFERRVGEYSKDGFEESKSESKGQVMLSDDF